MQSVTSDLLELRQPMRTLKLPAELASLSSFIDLVAECAAAGGWCRERIPELQIAVEEALVNVFSYAYPEGNGEVEVSCRFDEHVNRLVIEITDSGMPFDFSSVPAPDRSTDLDQRRLGGFGVPLMKEFADEVHIYRSGSRNILRLCFDGTKHSAVR
jgi:anti-sigma regulatory factor (Ser/Thr protein kinase)